MKKILLIFIDIMVTLSSALGVAASVLYFGEGNIVQGVGTSFSASIMVLLLIFMICNTVHEFNKDKND